MLTETELLIQCDGVTLYGPVKPIILDYNLQSLTNRVSKLQSRPFANLPFKHERFVILILNHE